MHYTRLILAWPIISSVYSTSASPVSGRNPARSYSTQKLPRDWSHWSPCQPEGNDITPVGDDENDTGSTAIDFNANWAGLSRQSLPNFGDNDNLPYEDATVSVSQVLMTGQASLPTPGTVLNLPTGYSLPDPAGDALLTVLRSLITGANLATNVSSLPNITTDPITSPDLIELNAFPHSINALDLNMFFQSCFNSNSCVFFNTTNSIVMDIASVLQGYTGIQSMQVTSATWAVIARAINSLQGLGLLIGAPYRNQTAVLPLTLISGGMFATYPGLV